MAIVYWKPSSEYALVCESIVGGVHYEIVRSGVWLIIFSTLTTSGRSLQH